MVPKKRSSARPIVGERGPDADDPHVAQSDMGVRLINSLVGMFSSRTADSPAPASPPQPAVPQLARKETSAGRTDCQNDFIKNVEGIIATSQTLGTAQGHLSAQVLHWRVERTIGSGGHPTFSLLRQTKGNRWKKVLATSSTEDLLLRAKQAWVCRTYMSTHRPLRPARAPSSASTRLVSRRSLRRSPASSSPARRSRSVGASGEGSCVGHCTVGLGALDELLVRFGLHRHRGVPLKCIGTASQL